MRDSILLLNVNESHQGKNTIDTRYRREIKAFFFAICPFVNFEMNLAHSCTLLVLLHYKSQVYIPSFFICD